MLLRNLLVYSLLYILVNYCDEVLFIKGILQLHIKALLEYSGNLWFKLLALVFYLFNGVFLRSYLIR